MDNIAARPERYRVYAPNGELSAQVNHKVAVADEGRRAPSAHHARTAAPSPNDPHQLNIHA